MAGAIAKQSFHVNDLTTNSVTLYPARAHVVRDIDNVALEKGSNEIEIYGLTPSVDDQSVQIDGHGMATITDMTVELVDNRQSFQDLYPDDDAVISEPEIEPYEDSDDDRTPEVIKLKSEIKTLKREIGKALETQEAATKQLKTLDSYTDNISSADTGGKALAEMLDVYEFRRQQAYNRFVQVQPQLEKLQKDLMRKERDLSIAGTEYRKKKAEEAKARQKRRDAKQRRDDEKLREKAKERSERLAFYPKQVYRVILRVEASSLDTPASSRRNSVDSVTLAGERGDDEKENADTKVNSKKTPVNLSLAYVTSEASWCPRYDLSVSSTQKTAQITYRAELSNRTSETWKDAKVILSTSQTTFSGLEDKPPTLPGVWNVKLAKHQDVSDGGRLSGAEIYHADHNSHRKPHVQAWNRAQYFGAGGLFGPGSGGSTVTTHRPVQHQAQMQQMQQMQQGFFGQQAQTARSQPQPRLMKSFAATAGIPPAQAAASSLFGQANRRNAAEGGGSGLFGSAPRTHRQASGTLESGSAPAANATGEGEASMALDNFDYDALIAEPSLEPLDFDAGDWEDNGLTTTYEIPGARTLVPSSLARRHKIAKLSASNIDMSYFAIPKMRAAAYLRAKFRNPSTSVTLLKGTAGITLDGSFLGNTMLTRSSPGQNITLHLGSDPAIQISYQKPTVHRGSQGILFNKESAHQFARAIFITNTRAQPIELVLLDQIPVSQDERLRIDVTTPRGLAREGDAVKTGSATKTGATEVSPTSGWGKAVASLKKGGEVQWKVNLEKNIGCVLKLEYEARLPGSENVVLAS